jgi:hypothetical protein
VEDEKHPRLEKTKSRAARHSDRATARGVTCFALGRLRLRHFLARFGWVARILAWVRLNFLEGMAFKHSARWSRQRCGPTREVFWGDKGLG